MAAEQVAVVAGSASPSAAQPGATIACSGVSAANLDSLLGGFLQAGDTWGLAWRLDRIAWLQGEGGRVRLFYASGPNQAHQAGPLTPADLLAAYLAGRVFGAAAEWRWQPEESETFAVLGLAEDRQALTVGLAALGRGYNDASVQRREGWQVVEAIWRLTGSIVSERANDPLAARTWFETRYPVPLVYPVSHNGERVQPRLHVSTYADASGAVRFTRFRKVSPQ